MTRSNGDAFGELRLNVSDERFELAASGMGVPILNRFFCRMQLAQQGLLQTVVPDLPQEIEAPHFRL